MHEHLHRTIKIDVFEANMFPSYISSSMPVNFDEHRWLRNVRKILDEDRKEDDDDDEIPVSIFNVPKTLISTNPDLYTPQLVAIGPYHHNRPELYDMERYKLIVVRKTQKQLQCSLKIQTLVEHLIKLDSRIRACYHRYLDFSEETLAWMVAIDASFLLEFLETYAIKEGNSSDSKSLLRVSSRMSHLVDYTGRNLGHSAILRDIVMLENQMPMFVLRKMLEFRYASLKSADNMLVSMLIGLCKEVSPFRTLDLNLMNIEVSDYSHLLDFLYHTIAPKFEERIESITVDDQIEEKCSNSPVHGSNFRSMLCKLLIELKRLIKNVLQSETVKVALRFPWKIISNLPGFAILKLPVESLLHSQEKETNSQNKIYNTNRPPLVEEITIPSVTDLSKIGVRFLPTGNVTMVVFDINTATFHLPMVTLDVNTEVILRNLVAYEASNASGPLLFTRYTELMNGIIDTEEDVKLLREQGVIWNCLKSDEDAAELWNGMSKSIRLTKVPFLDKVIEDVNKYYDGKWRVKFGKFIKLHVFSSWQFLTLLATVLLLFLVALQAFCLVYSCSRNDRIKY